ncbi:DUF2201 family putative metallopeptidase [Halomonas sp. hl-4]|uniref:DUF2201 family putative metallopeptidase n=1 Tax=Halomonas sp. hl-4 TaxID=1761789 RepID=UPI000BB88D9B|nr:hypothetical protein [Halomonas sp. hl-4]SNY97916.1 Putative metallopeptidase domain-containing protein [Halomonas sp. hl-4]
MKSKNAQNDQLVCDLYGEGVITKQKNLWQSDRHVWNTEQPATAFLAKQLQIKVATTSNVPTASTDGRFIHVNPLWGESLDETTRRFMQAHLVWHCAAGHFRPAPGRENRRWHLACDHEVNVVLMMQGFEMPSQAVLFPACIGKSLIDVYTWLADHPLLGEEVSLDKLLWQADGSGHEEDEIKPLSESSLAQFWQQQAREVVHRYFDTSYLRPLVTSWLSKRW